MGKKIFLVACSKTKRKIPSPAQFMYISDLFRKASELAKRHCDKWYILSAKYHLVQPDQLIEYYDKCLNNMSVVEQKEWAHQVFAEVRPLVSSSDTVVILAPIVYRKFLIKPISQIGCKVEIPMEGMTIGLQLQWLKNQLGEK